MQKSKQQNLKRKLNKAIVIGLIIGGSASCLATLLRRKRKKLQDKLKERYDVNHDGMTTRIDVNDAEDESRCKTAEWDRNGTSYPNLQQ